MQRSADDALAQCLVRGRLIGRRARISASPDPTRAGLSGRIVDETKNTLTLHTGSGDRCTVPKPDHQLAIQHEDREVLLDGSTIAHRPEDRVKKAKVDR
jgi:ribonuclease P protein subunit POP4